MKLTRSKFRNPLLIVCTLVTLSGSLAKAQTKSEAASAAQNSAVVPARITKAVDETRLVQLKGNVHPIARAGLDQGALDSSQPLTRGVILLQRSAEQEAALRQLLDDQQNKTTANYHAWLTPDQFGKQFGPADSDVQTVTQWLTTQGFQNIKVGAGKTAIEFSGSVGQVQAAFHTEIHKFLMRGEVHNANVSDPQIPEALAPVVAGVVGLHNVAPRAHVHKLGTFRKTKTTGEVKPLFTFAGCGSSGTLPCFAVGPGDFAKIYNVPSTVKGNPAGQGVTIALVGDSNINIQDAHDFRTIFGLPTNDPTVIVNGPDPGLGGDEIEADLDTQVAGAVAPNAKILLVVTEQPQSGAGAAGVDLSALYIINNNLADVMSKSFGACESSEGAAGNAFENALYEQAAAQGITVMVSAGDNGSAGCDPTSTNLDVAAAGLAVSGDASTPFNVAVGGTDFNSSLPNYATTFWGSTNAASTQTSALGYVPETTWNGSCAFFGLTGCTATIINQDSTGITSAGPDLAAGSGGASGVYAKPSWQTGTGVPADGVRDLPDVSLFASNGVNGSFYIICEQDANSGTGSSTSSCDLNSPFNDFQGVGGTSASSPAFAAIIALVNQQTGQRQGNVNYVLYPLASAASNTCTSAASPLSTCVFYDIPAGFNNSVACQGGSPNCSNTSTSSTAFGILTTTAGGTIPAFSTTPGYDLATGLGSVNVTNLLAKWTTASFKPSTTTFVFNAGAPVNAITHGAPVSVSGAVTGSGGTPTGFVELIQGTTAPGPVLDTFALTNGAYSGTTLMLPGTNGAPYSVVARYAGDGTFAASTSTTVGTVNSISKEPSAVKVSLVTFGANNNPILSTSATSLPYGTAYILQVAVTNSSGSLCVPPPFSPTLPCPTGSVTLLDGGQPLKDFLVPNTSTATQTAQLNNAGFVEDQPIQLSAGSHPITASYAGDVSYSAQGTSNTLSLTITQAPTTTMVVPSVSVITSGGSVTLTALVSTGSNSAVGPSGTVQFLNGSTALGTAAATCTPAGATASAGASCTATLTTTLSVLMPPGTDSRRRLSPPWAPMLLLASLAVCFAYLATRIAPTRQRRYAYATIILLIAGAISFAGCGGGSGGGGGGGGGGHTDSITAKYSGDTNYSGSTSTAVSITIQ